MEQTKAHFCLCRRNCGREFPTEGYKISSNMIGIGGCTRNLHQMKDRTNQRIGRLTALRQLDFKESAYVSENPEASKR